MNINLDVSSKDQAAAVSGTEHHRSRFSSALSVGVMALMLAILCVATFAAGPRVMIVDPLNPPDTSSPSATLICVQKEVGAGARIVHMAFDEHIHSAGLFESKETREKVATARAHLHRAMRCLDLSALAPASREKIGTERVLMLNEVLKRVPPASPPDGAGGVSLPDRWNIPNTEIRIARVASGPRNGEFLFTAETVERISEFYASVSQQADPENFDFYKFYSLSPGDLMPPKWYGFVLALPQWALDEFADQAAWQWAAFVLTLVLFAGFSAAFFALVQSGRARAHLPGSLRRLLAPCGIIIAAMLAGEMIREINITGTSYAFSHAVLVAALYVSGAWLAMATMLSLADWLASASGVREQSIDAGMLRLAMRLLGVLAGGGVLAYGAAELGLPLVGIVAGLGVGGLAIALAAQPTIENFIGGVMIYADRPVRVGDQCKFGDISGIVEEIGIRSTRIRAADRALITIPNGDFSKQRLINVDRRDRLVVNAKVGLRYGTTQAQLREILAAAARFFEEHALIDGEGSTLRLVDFGALSLDLELTARLLTYQKTDLPPLRQEILLQIAGIAEKVGTGLVERA